MYYNFILFYFVFIRWHPADFATLYSLRTACLFQLWSLHYYLINIVNIKILSLNLFSRST